MLYAISSSPLGWFCKTPQQLRRGHLATQHPLALLPHLRRHLTALHADGGFRVLHGNRISLVSVLAHRKTPRVIREESGACGRIRTGDLLITSELLCQLSHTSINADGSIAYFAGAVNRFSGEESLFLLRLLPKWVRTGNDNT